MANALNFDGVDDFIITTGIPTNADLEITNKITVEGWIYATKTTGTQNVMSRSTLTDNTGYIFPRTENGWTTLSLWLFIGSWQVFEIPYGFTNSWHHVAATYDGAEVKIYLDGLLELSRPQTGNIDSNLNPLVIGDRPGFNEFFGGSADDLRIWNIDKNVDEIGAKMRTELTGLEDNLVGYYSLNQGVANSDNTSITTVTDGGTNGLDGLLNGFDLTSTTSNFVIGNTGGVMAEYTGLESIENLAAGDYKLVITDLYGCIKEENF